MKTNYFILALVSFGVNTLPAQVAQTEPAPADATDGSMRYAEVARDAHSRTWARVSYETNALGEVTTNTSSYQEIATGLHYREGDQWLPSESKIVVLPNNAGAAASKGQHKVLFPLEIKSGVIQLATPENQWLRSRIWGLAYFDGATGESVLLAEVKESDGQLVGENTVIYPDAFTDFRADIRYTYTRAAFEQDVVLREQPPAPETFGMSKASTRLQVLTEFVEAPTPTRESRQAGGLADEALGFGQMSIGSGKAFSVDAEGDTTGQVPVAKEWAPLDGRDFLIEEVYYEKVADQLQKLPAAGEYKGASLQRRGTGENVIAGLKSTLPKRYAKAAPKSGTKRMAQATPNSAPGFVMDYVTLISQADFTFAGNTNYYVTAAVNLSGTTKIEGGTIVKFASGTTPKINITGAIDCRTSMYRPAVFTAKDDNTVGEAFGSGTPGIVKYGSGLGITTSGNTLTNLRFSYLEKALSFVFNGNGQLDVGHAQFVNCKYPLTVVQTSCGLICGTTLNLNNALAFNCDTFFQGDYGILQASHLTVNQCTTFGTDYDQDSSASLVNSLLVAVGSWGNMAHTEDTSTKYDSPDPGTIFETTGTGAGSHYLAAAGLGNTYRNAGLTALPAGLLADLRLRTTYPPEVIAGNITDATTWLPRLIRDTDEHPALGYHYDPLDYVVNAKTVSANLTLKDGVVLGTYGALNSYGLGLLSGTFLSEGTPTRLNWIVRYNTVQEQSTTSWSANSAGASVRKISSSAVVSTRFTGWSLLGGSGDHFYDSGGSETPTPSSFSHSQFGGGKFTVYPGTGLTVYPGPTALTNCLWQRVYVMLRDNDSDSHWYLFNNLFYGGTLYYRAEGDNPVLRAYDNLFDKAKITKGGGANFTHDYNGYVTGQNRLAPNGANDVILPSKPEYESGPLGDWYLKTATPTSTLVDADIVRTPSQVGLFHYTVKVATNSKEGDDPIPKVDIGFHYASVNGNNQPIDSDGDGLADYFEDTNGNGVYDTGDIANWNSGVWSQPFGFGATAIHATLLPTGKVLHGNVWLYTPQASDPSPNTSLTPGLYSGFNTFCSGHTLMADGTMFVAGGHIETPAGVRSVAVYSPVDDFWTRLPSMDVARWYPTCITLDNGEILVAAGTYATGNPEPFAFDDNSSPEVWNPESGAFRKLEVADKKVRFYPYMFVDPTQPSGGVFYAGPELLNPDPDFGETAFTTMRLSTTGTGALTTLGVLGYHHEHAPAVMYEPGKILVAGGCTHWCGTHPNDPDPGDEAEWIDLDLTQWPPAWTVLQNPMNYARMHHNGTLLPDGTVLITGGHNSATDYDPPPSANAAVKTAELWDPQNPSQWTKLADCPTYRGYHSTALLLPDGRVLSAGGTINPATTATTAELFYPPYLFKGPRPVITIAPSLVSYGQPFTIQTAPADTVSKVTLLRLGSVTHSFNANQRFLSLTPITGGSGSWNVTAPSDARDCPPGHYMLFVLNQLGVPSVATVVQFLPDTAPDISMVCPANGGFVQPGDVKVSAKVKNTTGVTSVGFYRNAGSGGDPTILIQEATQSTDGHYSITWVPPSSSTSKEYSLKAKAIKTGNIEVDSPEITVTVNVFPEVTVSYSPGPGSMNGATREFYYFPIASLTATATGSDADGVSLMELYDSATLRVSSTSQNPISYTWQNLPRSFRLITPVVRDNSGIEKVGYAPFEIRSGGTLDTSFLAPPLDGADETVNAIAIQTDGKVLIGGVFASVNGQTRNRIARLIKEDGSLDSNFNPSANGPVNAIALQSDGKILIGGDFTTPRNRIARLNSDGSLDNTFDPGGSVNAPVHSLAAQAGGKVLIGGAFTTIGGTGPSGIARLNDSGTVDTSFNPGTGATGGADPAVHSVAVQSDGKVLIGGGFTTVDGTGRNRIARLNDNGSVDTGFNPDANGTVNAIRIQSDGKILIGGAFTMAGGSPRKRLARLNSDGAVDAGFNAEVSDNAPDNSVLHSIAVQSDGKLLIGGNFTKVKGTTAETSTSISHIARLLSDGNLDTNFRPGPLGASQYGPDNTVRSVAIQADGLIVIGGDFSRYDVAGLASDRGSIARIGGL